MLPCHTAQNGEVTYWLGVVAFGKQAELLAKHQKGDLISVAGNMQLNQWKAQGGTQSEAPQVIADSVICARTTRPGNSRKPANSTGAQKKQSLVNTSEDFDQTPPFDDAVPF